MQVLYTLLLAVIGVAAGFIGSMTGLGGAVVIMPVLAIFLGVPVEYAVGASLVATIATSSGAAAAYIRDRITNIRIGMSLEIGTTMGAIGGALAAAAIYAHNLSDAILVLFGIALLSSLYVMLRRKSRAVTTKGDRSTRILQLDGSYYDKSSKRNVHYKGVRWLWGELVMICAGFLSGLLGIGSGVLKVLGMDSAMRLPIKVSTATSDFMIGVTAVTGSGIYWALGYIRPTLVAPVVVGTAIGAYMGSKVMENERNKIITRVFLVILVIVAVESILRGVGIA
ncbi:MAG: sulfite exporter TauE/SafE family protein [Candidatus Marsarchaeota archaeon]|jgi:uncharacterized membrane protein YfcA|nr:sulfite exporter TauE/SafE family protein [Candidatus Marsarchaeota archaeon]MCL5111451.1 sulfite exporter TauE/SafE family protein [Candidatus Marsarchaeota archaeon]